MVLYVKINTCTALDQKSKTVKQLITKKSTVSASLRLVVSCHGNLCLVASYRPWHRPSCLETNLRGNEIREK